MWPPFYLLPAGITDPGYNGVVNQRETNFVLFVAFCSAL
jgi:hypothetical protein